MRDTICHIYKLKMKKLRVEYIPTRSAMIYDTKALKKKMYLGDLLRYTMQVAYLEDLLPDNKVEEFMKCKETYAGMTRLQRLEKLLEVRLC